MKTTVEIVKNMTWKEFCAALRWGNIYAGDRYRYTFVHDERVGFMTVSSARNYWRLIKRGYLD